MDAPQALAHEAIYETVESVLGDAPLGRLLDVPAGEGALAVRLRGLGFDVHCCDLYPDIFQLSDVEIRSGNLDGRLPYDTASFEHVVCVEGLEHISNPSNAIGEFSRVLAPGGRLIVSVPNIMNIEERFKWLINGYTSHFKPLSEESQAALMQRFPGMPEIGFHVNPIGYSELRFLLEKNGFRIDGLHADKAKANSWVYLPAVWLIRLIGKAASAKRQKDRWTQELNSNPVLLGGNTLIFSATKI